MSTEPDTNPPQKRTLTKYAVIAGLLFSSFSAGLLLDNVDASREQIKKITINHVDFKEFWQVWGIMENRFNHASSTDKPTVKEHIDGAIKGLVNSYEDPYTVFLPSMEAGTFKEDMSGEFFGVGMEIGIRNSVLTVISPLPGTPAEKSGLLAGDKIIKIDDTKTNNLSVNRAVELIRGEKGTEVVLEIYRPKTRELKNISVVRDRIKIPTSKVEQFDDVFVITLYNFNALSVIQFREALEQYDESDAHKLILDLRGNSGGFLQAAVDIASHFLEEGKVIVKEVGNNDKETTYRSSGKLKYNFAPDNTVILINGGSASAAEIVASALQEHEVVTLIGEKSFGKFSVQELINLPSNSSLKITIARWFTPKGNSYLKEGVAPDILINRSAEQIKEGTDNQLSAALDFLNGKEVISEDQSSTTVPVEILE